MSNLRNWLAARSVRERRMILVMVVLLALTLIWAGVIRPVRDGLSSARQRHEDAVIRLGETRNAVDAVKSAQRAGIQVLPGPISDAVRAQAETAGFTLSSLDQDGPDRVRITIASARPAALFGWLARLEQSGILVETSAITGNGDQTVAAQLALRARSS